MRTKGRIKDRKCLKLESFWTKPYELKIVSGQFAPFYFTYLYTYVLYNYGLPIDLNMHTTSWLYYKLIWSLWASSCCFDWFCMNGSYMISYVLCDVLLRFLCIKSNLDLKVFPWIFGFELWHLGFWYLWLGWIYCETPDWKLWIGCEILVKLFLSFEWIDISFKIGSLRIFHRKPHMHLEILISNGLE